MQSGYARVRPGEQVPDLQPGALRQAGREQGGADTVPGRLAYQSSRELLPVKGRPNDTVGRWRPGRLSCFARHSGNAAGNLVSACVQRGSRRTRYSTPRVAGCPTVTSPAAGPAHPAYA